MKDKGKSSQKKITRSKGASGAKRIGSGDGKRRSSASDSAEGSVPQTETAQVTERKQAEEALKESEQKYKLLIEATNTGYVIIDESGRVMDANQEYVRMTGRDRIEDILGRPVTDWTASYDLERNAAEVRKCMEIGSVHNLVIDYVDTQGKTTPVEIDATVLPKSSFARIFTICRDITEHKQLEEKLQASEERFRRSFEDSPVGVTIVTPDMHFQSVNKRLCDITGYPEAELIGKHFADITHPDDVEEGISKTRRVLAGETDHFQQEKRYLRKDGTTMWARTSARLIRDAKGKPLNFLTVIEDITTQIQSRLALKQSEEKFRRLYNETPVLLHSIDRAGILVDVNDYWLKTMGYDRGEVIGRKVADFFTDASRKYAEEVVQPEFFQDGVVKDIVYQFIKKNGEVLDVLLSANSERDDAGKVVRSLAVIEDITERKRIEVSLRRSEERYRDLFENAIDPIFIVDDKQNYLDVNKRTVELLGYSREELLSMNIRNVLPPEQLPRSENAFNELVSRGAYQQFIGKMRKKDGTFVDIEVSSSAIVDNGRVIGSRDIIRDITERKRAEGERQKSERMLQTIIDTEPDCIKVIDEESRLIMMNRAGLNMIQADALDQVKGQFVCPMVAPENQQAFMDLTRKVFQGGSGSLEFRMVGMHGRQLWLETHAVPLRNEKEEIVALLGVTRDITGRKQAEEKISTYSSDLQRLLAVSREMTATTDIARLYRNTIQTAVDLLHFDFSTIMVLSDDRSMLTITDSIGFPASMIGHFHLVEGQGLATYALKNMTPEFVVDFQAETRFDVPAIVRELHIRSALCVPMMLEDRVFGVLIGHTLVQREFSGEDIAIYQSIGNQAAIAIKNAMNLQALRENQERLDLALKSAHMGVWRWEIRENRRYFDDLTCQVLGINATNFMGTVEDFYRAVHPEDREKLRAAIARTLEHDVPYEPSYRIIWPDGSIHYITSRGRLFRDDKGQPARINGILWDITDQRRVEQELIETEKLESIGTLAGGIAHDFNNLLQGVFGFISMAKLTFDQKEKSLAMLAQAEKALHQSVNLTSQLLTFSKGGKPLKKVFALRPLIENSVAFALSGSRTTYEIVTDENLRAVEADEGQIGQVIQNIVLNADQAMPLGGMIRVSIRNMSAAALVPPADLQGDLVEISIRDRGTGILAEHLTRIFDPYFTTKEKGSGLGLATSYSIIKNHGGLVRVQSEIGKGTTFFIYLPASDSAVEGPKSPAIPSLTRKGRILVMDDEELIRMVAGELLASFGHEVAFAETGETALEAYRAARDADRPFDIVILDLTIRGGMGGMETLQKLIEIDPDVKAIVSSGYSDDTVMSNYRKQGFRAFLKKPYNIEELQGTLNALLS